jgi:translation initiation factor IF-1
VAAYRMRLPNGYELVAHVTRKLQPVIGAIQPGDRMELELSPFDLSRGRIIGRCSDTESVPDSAP